MAELRVARSELVLGAGGAGRSARAEALAAAWIAAAPHHRAVCIDTAQPWDEELRDLIRRCRRASGGGSGPALPRLEEPTELAHALGQHSRPDTLIVVDCLGFWLTASLVHAMAPDESEAAAAGPARTLRMVDAVNACAGPLVLVSNCIDSEGVQARPDLQRLVGTLGTLEQQAVAACERVTLMSAGLPLTLKDMG
ncbi:bifunctional adenosylcobinamide kinase/adenosylcobinamide-phosphate guanylyltransferase [Ramlibacter sp. AN1015]|uniref:bifunctional adenosylcobinamide kinase/adenosylcobinamide-phosphate guanylyltransferase n=1 Tax=Ramlibacter sp. AN1015 TaxID=3133428 RepID=UPI0030C5CD17